MRFESELLRRKRATGATLNKYRTKAHDWKRGQTCVHLARFHLRKMGHKVPKLPPVRSLLGAKRALESRGWATVADMLDAMPFLERIPAARMLIGDIVAVPSDPEADGLGSILVHVGQGRLMGWHDAAEEKGMTAMQIAPADMLGCWRV